MYNSIIDAASLKNQTILNDFRQSKVTVNFEPESTATKYHYNFLLEIEDDAIDASITKIQQEMLPGWYAFFWSKTSLFIVFDAKRFQIDLPDGWSSQALKDAQAFGRSQGIQEIYLNFEHYFKTVYLS